MTGKLRAAGGLLLLAGALAAAVVILRAPLAALFSDRTQLAETIRSAGWWGPLVLMALVVAQVILAPIPGQALNFAAGYLYGIWLGTLYSWVGLVLGSILAILLGRVAGRPLVARLVDPGVMARLDRLAAGQGRRFFFLVFLLPFLPDDAACFLAGLSPLPLSSLIPIVAAGRLPGVIAAVWVGTQAEQMSWQGWAVMAILGGVILLAAWRFGSRGQDALLRLAAWRPHRAGRQRR